MNLDRLFLLKPDFMSQGKGPFFCPGCAQMAGLLEFYPALKSKLEVRYLEFPRPRAELIELLGTENQGCPVLILKDPPSDSPLTPLLKQANGRWFVAGEEDIARYLAQTYGSGVPH